MNETQLVDFLERPRHLLLGHCLNDLLVDMGVGNKGQRIAVYVATFDKPIEKPLEPAVTRLDV